MKPTSSTTDLFGAYLHQDSMWEYGDLTGAVRAFFDDTGSEALQELDSYVAFLDLNFNNREIERVVTESGCGVGPVHGRSYKDFLEDIRKAISIALVS